MQIYVFLNIYTKTWLQFWHLTLCVSRSVLARIPEVRAAQRIPAPFTVTHSAYLRHILLFLLFASILLLLILSI